MIENNKRDTEYVTNGIADAVIKIIDFFFTRREKHIDNVADQIDKRFNDMLETLPEKAPKVAKAFYQAGKSVIDVLDKEPDEECDLCNGTGTRNDTIVKGECNKCEGKGLICH